MSDCIENENIFTICHKSIFRHIVDFLSKPLPIITLSVAIFGVLWTFGQTVVYYSGATPPKDILSFYLLIGCSIFASLIWNIYKYMHWIPEGFENESLKSQYIAHIQRPLWQFHLAKTLLTQKLIPLEHELQDIESGNIFIVVEKPETMMGYISWSQSRPKNLLNMLDIAKKLLIIDFPTALRPKNGKSVNPIDVLNIVNTIERFYSEIVAFERSSYSILPAERFHYLHQLQYGWTNTFRDAIQQLFGLIDHICECIKKKDYTIKYEIIFKEPEGTDEYIQEIDRLKRDNSLNELWY